MLTNFRKDLFPLNLTWALRIPTWHMEQSLSDILWKFNHKVFASYEPMSILKRAIPTSAPMKIIEILPRLKDGGAFVKFSHADEITAQEIEGLIAGYLRENPVKPWFSPWRRVRTNLVLGRPWLEDLYRFPSWRIKVEFVPPVPGGEVAELSQETLYSLFRKYGKIAEMSSQPSDSKVLPKFAYLDFSRMRHAIMARNCMHGFKVLEEAGGGKAGTELRLSFEAKHKSHFFRDWIVNHPRVVIPIIAAAGAVLAAAVFGQCNCLFATGTFSHN